MYSEMQVGANTLPAARITSPDTAAIGTVAAVQAVRAGEALQQAGEMGGRIATDMQNEANQLRVIDASNQAKEHMFDLMYNKDSGLLNQKGVNALSRPDGKDLPTEYGDRFTETTSKMAASLGNDQQRRMFQQQVGSMRTQLQGTAMQHVSGEFKSYQVSTFDGTVSTAQREIALMGASGNVEVDPITLRSKLDDAGDRILAATRQKGRLLGLSAEQADVEARKSLSNAHILAIGGALEQGKIEYADLYFKKNIGQMDADDILRVKGKLDGEVSNRISLTVAGETVRKMAPRIQTGDAERVFNIMLGTESGSQQFKNYGKRPDGTLKGTGFLGELKRPDGKVSTEISVGVSISGKEMDIPTLVPTLTKAEVASLLNGDKPSEAIVQKAVDHAKDRIAKGKSVFADPEPLTSKAGAIGIAQVMPGTAPEAAKLAGLEWDEQRYKTDADYNKALGMAYFQKQLQDNGGDAQKAMAAYNAGPGALRDAIKKADQSARLNKTDPTVQAHGWLDFMPKETKDYVAKNIKAYEAGQGNLARPTFAEIDDQLRADPRLAGNPKRYQVAREEASRQFEEQTKAIKQKEEESVATAMRAVVENGGRYSDLPASIRGALPPKEIDNVIGFAQKISKGDDTTSLELYNRLTAHPDQLARYSDAQFYALRRELSEGDFKHFSTERAKQTGATPSSNGPGDINTAAIKQALDGRLRMMQIDPSPKDDGGADAARIGGIRRFVDTYFYAAQREAGKKLNDVEVSAHIDALFAKNAEFRGWFGNSSGPMLGMKIGDVPSADKDGIKAALKRGGNDNPTDAQVMNVYWSLKVARK